VGPLIVLPKLSVDSDWPGGQLYRARPERVNHPETCRPRGRAWRREPGGVSLAAWAWRSEPVCWRLFDGGRAHARSRRRVAEAAEV